MLEAVAVGQADLHKALHDLRGRDHLGEVVVLSTCMRTEVYATVSRYHGAVGDVRTFLSDWSGIAPEALSDDVYDYYGEVAARHLLRVASGLDSAVLGEGEILRQVKAAWEAAREEEACGPALGLLFRRAVETGKRVRHETAIARGTTSLSHTALSLAGAIGAPADAIPPDALLGTVGTPADLAALTSAHALTPPAAAGEASGEPCHWSGLLAGRTVLVIGAGEMGSAVAVLAAGSEQAGPILVANRTAERAGRLARRVGGQPVAWADLPAAVTRADVVIVATASPEAVLDRATVAAALAGRTDRRLVVVDLSMPRNVHSGVGDLPGVTLFDVSHLKAHAEAAMERRRQEIPAAEAIVADEVDRLRTAAAHRTAAPVVAALQARGEEIRTAELARLSNRLGDLDERQRRAVESLTRGIVAKLLHQPTVQAKAAAAAGDDQQLLTALEQLFDL